jgi:hypothetical protein
MSSHANENNIVAEPDGGDGCSLIRNLQDLRGNIVKFAPRGGVSRFPGPKITIPHNQNLIGVVERGVKDRAGDKNKHFIPYVAWDRSARVISPQD